MEEAHSSQEQQIRTKHHERYDDNDNDNEYLLLDILLNAPYYLPTVNHICTYLDILLVFYWPIEVDALLETAYAATHKPNVPSKRGSKRSVFPGLPHFRAPLFGASSTICITGRRHESRRTRVGRKQKSGKLQRHRSSRTTPVSPRALHTG